MTRIGCIALVSVVFTGCGASRSTGESTTFSARTSVSLHSSSVDAEITSSLPDVATTVPSAGATLRELTQMGDESVKYLSDALEVLKRRCMADLGYEYTPAPFVPQVVYRGYPTDDMLSKDGYNWRMSVMTGNVSVTPTLSSAAQSALDTTCGPAAAQQLRYQDYTQAHQVISDADSDMVSAAYGDSRFQSAQARWSDCMSKAGYDVTTLEDALALAASLADGLAGPKAVKMALADVHCQRTARILETLTSIVVERTAAWVDSNAGALEEVHRQDEAIVAQAKVILNG